MQKQRASLFLLSFALLAVLSSAAMAQVDQIDQIDPEPEPEVPRYFGVGAGYIRTVALLDFKGMNDVSKRVDLGEFAGPFQMDIGGLMFTPGYIRNLRVGVFAGSGTKQNSAIVHLGGDSGSYTRTVYFNDVVVTSQFDLAFPVTTSFAIFGGGLLGVGRYSFGLSQTYNNGLEFNDIFSREYLQSTTLTNFNRFGRMISYHLFVVPTVNFEYSLLPYMMLRLGVGYNTSFRFNDWSDEGGVKLQNVPAISANGPTFQVGVFFGLFQH